MKTSFIFMALFTIIAGTHTASASSIRIPGTASFEKKIDKDETSGEIQGTTYFINISGPAASALYKKLDKSDVQNNNEGEEETIEKSSDSSDWTCDKTLKTNLVTCYEEFKPASNTTGDSK